MPQYQFGTKRLEKSPLNQLLAMRKAEESKTSAQELRNLRIMKDFPNRQVFEKDGKYYEYKTDKTSGALMENEISLSDYTQALDTNRLSNQARQAVGLQSVPSVTPPPKEEGLYAKAKKFLGIGDDEKNKPIAIQTSTNPQADANQNLNKTVIGQPNTGGLNADVSKPPSGVKVDITKSPKGLPMDVTTAGDTMPIPSPQTENAYKASLNQMRKAEADKISLKGKPPPNTSERFLEKAKQKRTDARNKSADERSKDFTARKIGTGTTPQQLRKQGELLKGGYKESYERAKKVENMSPSQRRDSQFTTGRLKLPSTKKKDTMVQDFLQARQKKITMDDINKKALDRRIASLRPEDMSQDMPIEAIDYDPKLADVKGDVAVPKDQPYTLKPTYEEGDYAKKSKKYAKKGSPPEVKLRSSFHTTKFGKKVEEKIGKGIEAVGDFIAKPESKKTVKSITVGGKTIPVEKRVAQKKEKKKKLTLAEKWKRFIERSGKGVSDVWSQRPQG